MKNVILSALLLIFVLVSCNQKSSNSQSSSETLTADSTQLYACPMDADIIGKKGEMCSKCGMELTEKVANK